MCYTVLSRTEHLANIKDNAALQLKEQSSNGRRAFTSGHRPILLHDLISLITGIKSCPSYLCYNIL